MVDDIMLSFLLQKELNHRHQVLGESELESRSPVIPILWTVFVAAFCLANQSEKDLGRGLQIIYLTGPELAHLL